MKKKITIYDLAEKLQVSPATVSRSLNDHPSISQKTKDKIVNVAKELGYRTNKFAANLSKQRSNTIGVIVPKLDSTFMSTVIAGIEEAVNESGYNLIISQSLESEQKEKRNAKTLLDSGVDALLISLAYETEDFEHLKLYVKHKIPLLFFDRVLALGNAPQILINNTGAGYEATKHLIKQGCTNIIHVSGDLKRDVYRDRFEGYLNALRDYNLHFDQENLLEGNLKLSMIPNLINLIQSANTPIDGMFFSNDYLAAHCIIELQSLGYKIPEDLKIIGFNNDPICEVVKPKLTTIDYPGHKMGMLAGESILGHLNGAINIEAANYITLKHTLIIRDST